MTLILSPSELGREVPPAAYHRVSSPCYYSSMASGHRELIQRLARFAVVGILVTLAYTVIVWTAVERLGFKPVMASFVGFLTTVALSYFGQKHFAFQSTGPLRVELPRFLVTSTMAFAGSVGSMAVTRHLGWDYRWGILTAVVLIPLASFVSMFFWVFRRRDAAAALD